MPMTYLPPDRELSALAKKVNAKLPQGVSIDLYLIHDEGGRTETGIVFCCGPVRSRQTVRETLSEHDAGRLIEAVTNWSAQAQYMNRWTADPQEAGL